VTAKLDPVVDTLAQQEIAVRQLAAAQPRETFNLRNHHLVEDRNILLARQVVGLADALEQRLGSRR
jgi:hypothetical protein